MLRFEGRTVLITGSGTGIGLAVAKKFAENGASIIILGRRRKPLEDAAGELGKIISGVNSGATVRMFPGVDVADEGAVGGMFDSLKADGVTVDCIVNNAGVSGPVKCFASSPPDEFEGAIAIHLTGTFQVSTRALDVLGKGGRIVTISTFFSEERPLEQRPYRFRSPYTMAQGAKNRLAEVMAWELVDRGIASVATNPGPVHSDRIYKTVYPKAAAEFMRVGGFEYLAPDQVDEANRRIVGLLGESPEAVSAGIAEAAASMSGSVGRSPAELEATLAALLDKIGYIAEKIQKNTSRMIPTRQFLSQEQVALTVMTLCDEGVSRILNGRVVPGDGVFYPVRPSVGTAPPAVTRPDLSGRTVVIVTQPSDDFDVARTESLASHVEECGGSPVLLISGDAPAGYRESRFHSHVVDTASSDEVLRWLKTADSKMGRIAAVVHMTGNLPDIPRLTGLSRPEWDRLTGRFLISTAAVARSAIEYFAPGGGRDPRLLEGASGSVLVVGPDLPPGRLSGIRRGQVEVFRGALRPFLATVNQELDDVLKSRIRVFGAFAGTVAGGSVDHSRMCSALDFALSDGAASSGVVSFCVDEVR